MQKEAWSLSARFAWQKPWFRVLSLLLLASVGLACAAFFVRILPVIRGSTFVAHTNVYTGIDDIRSWGWVFMWPGVWIVSVVAGVITAYGVFRRDTLLAQAILAWLYAWSLPWGMGLFYLLLINTPTA